MNKEALRDLLSLIPRTARIENNVSDASRDLEVLKHLAQLHSSDLAEIKARLSQLSRV